MKTVRRVPKSVRLVDQDVQLLTELHAALPEHATEADVLARATQIGLLVLAAEAAGSGQPIEAIPVGVLVQRVRSRLLPVFELLAHHGALPALLTHGLGSAPSSFNASTSGTPARTPGPTVSVQASADVRALGGGFLDDDDD